MKKIVTGWKINKCFIIWLLLSGSYRITKQNLKKKKLFLQCATNGTEPFHINYSDWTSNVLFREVIRLFSYKYYIYLLTNHPTSITVRYFISCEVYSVSNSELLFSTVNISRLKYLSSGKRILLHTSWIRAERIDFVF